MMNENSKSAAKELFVGVLVTVLGGVILAWLIGEGVFQRSSSPEDNVVITLTNEHCQAMDFYVDDRLAAARVEPGATVEFNVTPGGHSTYTCLADTGSCGETRQVNWPRAATWEIAAGANCLTAVTVENRNCAAIDVWVDGELTVAAVQPGAAQTFQAPLGEHSVYYCNAGTQDCAPPSPITWTGPALLPIEPAAGCAVTVTVSNRHCRAISVRVDGQDALSRLGSGNTAQFQVAPGDHEVQICYLEPRICGEAGKVNWSQDAQFEIPRGQDC
jgi:hypothetical protein